MSLHNVGFVLDIEDIEVLRQNLSEAGLVFPVEPSDSDEQAISVREYPAVPPLQDAEVEQRVIDVQIDLLPRNVRFDADSEVPFPPVGVDESLLGELLSDAARCAVCADDVVRLERFAVDRLDSPRIDIDRSDAVAEMRIDPGFDGAFVEVLVVLEPFCEVEWDIDVLSPNLILVEVDCILV
jgi:hypothetical protein